MADPKLDSLFKEIKQLHLAWDDKAAELEHAQDRDTNPDDLEDLEKEIEGYRSKIKGLKIQVNKIKPGHYKDPSAYGESMITAREVIEAVEADYSFTTQDSEHNFKIDPPDEEGGEYKLFLDGKLEGSYPDYDKAKDAGMTKAKSLGWKF